MTASTTNNLDRSLRRWILILAIMAGVGIANIYYNQPLLNILYNSFSDHIAWVAIIPTATQIGFAVGMLLFAPLGDRLDRRRLILFQCVGLCVALFVAATAVTLIMLIIASFLIGLFASLAQQAGPFAAELVPPERRGYAIGTVMSGLLLGILLARTASGFIAVYLGWRAVFFCAVILILILAILVAKCLPPTQPTSTLPYHKLLRSLSDLFFELRGLREACLTGGALFAAFCLFWSVLALLLARPPFYCGPEVAGLFGLIGATGALAAPWAGKFADRQGSRAAISLAIGLIALSFLILFFSGSHIIGLVIGVIVLDVGVQVAQPANQSRVFALRSEARSRLNTVYIICYFTGGGIGSAVGVAAWQRFGWHGVCIAGLFFAAVAALNHFRGWRQELSN